MRFALQNLLIALTALGPFIVLPVAQASPNVDVAVKPDPPGSGDNTLFIKVVDDAGKGVDGAKISVTVFMPAMGTMPRMEEKTAVEPKGGGLYEASFDIPMSGTWEVALTVEHDGAKRVAHYSITTGIPGVMSKDSGKSVAGNNETSDIMDIGPARLQQIGVRFAEAKVLPLRRDVEAVGIVEQDQTHREEVTLRFSGYVVKQFRGRIGDSVKKGDPLFSVYSPDLVTAQSELLLADKLASGGHSLHQAAAEKLKNLGLAESEIAQIRKDGKPKRDVVIRSSISGTILEISVREGATVAAGQVTYVVGDLSKSYIVARVFQQDVGDLKVGQTAEVLLPGGSSDKVSGKIDLIYPQIEQGAGTANVRVVVAEFSAGLRPGVYVDVKFPVELGSRLTVPTEAILYSGRHRYIFVDRGGGRLEPREVSVGKTSAGMAEIRSGLEVGERVVASGTFLLGSEAQLRSALPKWTVKQGADTSATKASSTMNTDMPMPKMELEKVGDAK